MQHCEPVPLRFWPAGKLQLRPLLADSRADGVSLRNADAGPQWHPDRDPDRSADRAYGYAHGPANLAHAHTHALSEQGPVSDAHRAPYQGTQLEAHGGAVFIAQHEAFGGAISVAQPRA